VEVIAKVVHVGSTVSRAEAELRDSGDRLAARAVATFAAESKRLP
jgi:acyl-coenzyme A thioesterase PaaI-like protein